MLKRYPLPRSRSVPSNVHHLATSTFISCSRFSNQFSYPSYQSSQSWQAPHIRPHPHPRFPRRCLHHNPRLDPPRSSTSSHVVSSEPRAPRRIHLLCPHFRTLQRSTRIVPLPGLTPARHLHLHLHRADLHYRGLGLGKVRLTTRQIGFERVHRQSYGLVED
ncbi:uncharacterized protein LY89DRAFT_32056 [Mollisia scopiformis]|uniref:Uncharacterized protein n=1 Tax=Mollisia scopiformis TaxID=149040 RepID=A0A194XCN4_MOLSC|nr:uncharacterized protein LY89DRAFT_32056 [Mollisia scopiformis]KUJ17933.1 hypothetical protein LY89DRAFT_32056 [Mollisia scopiformis]